MWQVIYNITKKWWDRHKGHGLDRTSVPVWPNVRQKKSFVNSEIAQIFIKHNAATKVLTFPTTDIGHPSFSWLGTGIFTWRKVRLNKVLYMKMLRKRCLKTVIFVLESPWKVLDFAQQKSVWTLHTLQGDNSLKSVERFDHMMFVCRFQASRWSKPQREKLLCG
jgi:hypothetical protein